MKYLARITTIATLVGAFIITSPVFATAIQEGVNAAKGSEQPATLFGDSGIFSEITNVLLFVIGGVAVIMIVIGGLRYVISGGDAKQVEAAKNTILYAIVGIVIALLAYAAVSFITSTFADNGTSITGSSSNSGASTQ